MPLVINLCTDIAAGLSYIHTRDIIHGGVVAQVTGSCLVPCCSLGTDGLSCVLHCQLYLVL
jgi:hypothetical protein